LQSNEYHNLCSLSTTMKVIKLQYDEMGWAYHN
jgi:hypothetical protein